MTLERIGRYEILSVLGKGAMGVVYLARDPIIDREVALKTLRVDVDPDLAEEFRARFLREARAAGRLNHRGIVTVHDVGEDPDSGLVFIAMEMIRGRNLKEILAEGTRFRPSEAARIVAAVAEALDYAHQMGVVHRDIKPANIILTEDGIPKITDFGVARLESSNLTLEGQFIGTPNYMSPEQITGEPVDGRSDIFSTGVVMFELLTGQRPFPGAHITEVTLKIVREAPPIPSTLRPGLPPAFNPIVLKCLAKAPDDRFQTGGQVAGVLAALARSLVQRSPDDAERTGVFSPDLETRLHPPVGRDVPAMSVGERLRSAVGAIPIPEPLLRAVAPAWVFRIVLGWFLLWSAVIVGLILLQPPPPPPSPSQARLQTLSRLGQSLRSADAALDRGDAVEALRLAREVLDQLPASRAARAVAREARLRISAERSSAADRARAVELIAEGRRLYRARRYTSAAAAFSEALSLEPDSEVAASFLELARERSRVRTPRRRPGRTTRRRPVAATRATPRATPGTARLTVFFNSPLNAGKITVEVDGNPLAEIPFDFTRKGLFGIKRSGSGLVKRVLLVPSGDHTFTATLTDAQRGAVGAATLTRSLPRGSDWTLRVDLPGPSARPSFFLVRPRS